MHNRTRRSLDWVTIRTDKRAVLPDAKRICAILILPVITLLVAGCSDTPLFQLPDPAVRVLAFGDSTTDGPSDRQYTEVLQDDAAIDASAISNQGMGGETTTDGLPRLAQLLSSGLFPNTEIVILWEGGNDLIDFIQERDPFIAIPPDSPLFVFGPQLETLKANVIANLTQMIATVRDAGATPILVTYYFIPEQPIECRLSPLPTLLPIQAVITNAYVIMLNEVIRDVAMAEGVILIDVAALNDMLRADINNYTDCNHLSGVGNVRVAELMAPTIIAELSN